MQGYLCGPRIYEFDGWLFEVHGYCGPWPLRRDGELRKRAGRRFWRMVKRFDNFSAAEQAHYRVGGGCIALSRVSQVVG